MSTTAGAERVYPAGGGTSPAPAGGDPAPKSRSGKGGTKLDKKTIMWGGAGAVALFAWLSTRGGPAEDEVATTVQPATLDTTDTDLYTSLQPELEAIQNEIRDLPTPPKPGAVKPGKPTPARGVYRVKKSDRSRGDDLRKIARRFKVKRHELWRLNKRIIRRRPNHKGGRNLKAGMPIILPKKK